MALWTTRYTNVLLIFISTAITLSFIEVIISLFLSNSHWMKLSPRAVKDRLQHIYMTAYRDVFQFSWDRVQYDPQLAYILKPSSQFEFANVEFATTYSTNSAGLRDDEESLSNPEIIVLGDSIAMGWGVNQDQTFAQGLEMRTGKKVLNAGISSYGTVRERLLLDRLQLKSVKYIVIQYSENDIYENKTFYVSGNTLPITTRDILIQRFQEVEKARHYYPFKYLGMFAAFGTFGSTEKREEKSEVEYFIHALSYGGLADISSIQIMAFQINDNTSQFVDDLSQNVMKTELPVYIQKMKVLDFSNVLLDKDYFILDDHPNAHGHSLIADEIIKRL